MHKRNRIAPTEGLELNPIKNDGQSKFDLLSNFQATISKTADVLICKFHHGFSFTLPFNSRCYSKRAHDLKSVDPISIVFSKCLSITPFCVHANPVWNVKVRRLIIFNWLPIWIGTSLSYIYGLCQPSSFINTYLESDVLFDGGFVYKVSIVSPLPRQDFQAIVKCPDTKLHILVKTGMFLVAHYFVCYK